MTATDSLTRPAASASWSLDTAADAAWIWPAAVAGENLYVQFRQTFVVDDPATLADAVLDLAADTKFAAWVNGVSVGSGQFADYPDRRTFDRLAIGGLLRPGLNVLAVLVYHQGRGSSVYAPGAPGVLYRVLPAPEASAPLLVSGVGSFSRLAPDYVSGTLPMISPQLSFSFECDAQAGDDWMTADTVAGNGWAAITAAEATWPEGRRHLLPRPVARLETLPVVAGAVIATGSWWLPVEAAALPPAQRIRQAVLTADGDTPAEPVPADAVQGRYWRVDLGREEVGLLDLEVTAPAGAALAIGYGEHLADGRVRTHIGIRHFASGYRCRAGRQRFTHEMTRWAGRYLELHLTGSDEGFELHHLGLRPQMLPVAVVGSFASSDPLLDRIFEVSVRTMQLCMHEHYEDCPWREQALYANDMRNQAICGYTVFGNHAFAAHSLGLLGAGLREHGYLNLTAPTQQLLVIPSFTMAWVLAVADHYRYSGDRAVAEGHLTVIERILATLLPTLQQDQLPLLDREDHWHFYDWAPGLSGQPSEPTPPSGAALNLFFLLALEQASWLAGELGQPEAAAAWQEQRERTARSVQAAYWDHQAGAYRLHAATDAHPPVFTELAQALALLAGLPEPEHAVTLRAHLAAGESGWVPTTLSQTFYKFEAMMMAPEHHGAQVLDLIRRDWGAMLAQDATSFWETIEGEAAFFDAGSLCHGWSAIPVYFLHRYVLGARPVAPGRIERVTPGTRLLDRACGAVVTPAGELLAGDA